MKANSTSTPRKGKGSNLSPSSETSGTSEAKAQPYVPTPIETKALAAYKAAKEGRGPRLKVTINASDAGQVEAEHPNIWVGTLALMQAIGTTDLDFFDGLMRHLVNAGTGKGERASEQGANFMLAVVKGIEPRDQIEAMLAAQMAAVHNATMTFARRLAHVDIIPQQDSAQNAFNKLARTFAAQVAALKDYRSKGEQKMTVQHVHVADGGQAVIGNVGTPAPGGGASEKMKEQPHALAYAPTFCKFTEGWRTLPPPRTFGPAASVLTCGSMEPPRYSVTPLWSFAATRPIPTHHRRPGAPTPGSFWREWAATSVLKVRCPAWRSRALAREIDLIRNLPVHHPTL